MSNHLPPDQQIKAIHEIMERSTRFLHISGLAGILAGFIAIVASWIAINLFAFEPDSYTYNYRAMGGNQWTIISLGLSTLVLSFGLGLLLARRNAHKNKSKGWTPTSRRMLIYFATPLLTGGLVILLFWLKDFVALAAPLSLIFYGLALLHASHFTLTDIRYLGLIELLLGLVALYWIQHSLVIWTVGFGMVHIGYGLYIYLRYEQNS